MPEDGSPADRHFSDGMGALEMLRSADHLSEYRSDLERAVEAFSRAVEADSRHLGALRALAEALANLDRWLEAVDSYGAAVRLAPEDPDLRVGHAQALAEVKRHAEALREFDEALRRRENDVAALFGRAAALMALERFEPAVAAWDAVLRVPGKGPTVWKLRSTGPLDDFNRSRARAMRAICLAMLRRPDAVAAFRQAFEDEGPQLHGVFSSSQLTGAVGQFEAARIAFRQWSEAHAADPRTWRIAGEVWQAAGWIAEALTAAEHRVRLTPDDPHAWADQGSAYEAAGQLDHARTAYRRALAIRSDFPRASIRLEALDG